MSRIPQHAANSIERQPAKPRSLSCCVAQDTAQAASRMQPGRTAGTSRLLAHGMSGVMAGLRRNTAIVQPKIISGSIHSGCRSLRTR